MVRELGNFIDGSFHPAVGGGWIDDLAPATGRVHARIARSGAEDVERAAQAAKRALRGPWGRLTNNGRADLLEAVARGLEARFDELAAAESLDSGKPLHLARSMDIPRAIENFRFFAAAARTQSIPAHPMADALNYSLRQPLGIVGLITPWNLPLYLLSWKVAPALACGNAIIAKPSELTPLTAHLLAEVLAEAGLPEGVFNLIHGYGPEAGAPIVDHPLISGISFTGGTSTGRVVGERAGRRFAKTSLELGGKNATIVFDDADMASALATTVRAGFLNQGQICLCGSRILVQRSIYQPFLAALVERVESLKVGDPADPESDLGALISAAHREKVEGYLDLARESGAAILCGGGRPGLEGELAHGFFLEPTVIGGLPPDHRVSTEEIFGPVVTVHPFDDEREAVATANAVPYGLSASVWTSRLDRAHRVAANLEVGTVWVNTWLKRDLRVPFGGVKQSGIGREGGEDSLRFYSETKNVCVQL